jgi:hypothetical protein
LRSLVSVDTNLSILTTSVPLRHILSVIARPLFSIRLAPHSNRKPFSEVSPCQNRLILTSPSRFR